jgi:hypothetical protein
MHREARNAEQSHAYGAGKLETLNNFVPEAMGI